MHEESPYCYGKYFGSGRCTDCIYGESCRYYKASARGIDRGFRLVGLSGLGDWAESLRDPFPVPGCEEEEENRAITMDDLAAFLRYLMELDSYTLEILREIIAPSSGRPCTVADLSRLHGISRQSMHRKIFRVIRRYPELRQLLRSTLSRMPPRQTA